MARVRRNWTSTEDELLRRAVRTAEEEQRPLLWRELAKAVPGRSNKDCRRRWWNSLSEGNAKGPWTEEEDERITAAVQTHGTNWTLVSRDVKTRSSDQCSSHWSHVLDPNINYCDWDEQEDTDLLHQVHKYGTKWAYIASIHTPTRTTLALKNRYSTLRLKSESKNRPRQDSSSTERSWSRANSTTETAATSPTSSSHWSPSHSRNASWSTATHSAAALKFGEEQHLLLDGSGGDTEEDEDEETTTPTDLPTWPPHHHHQSLKVETANLPFIQASFANWDAWAQINDSVPSSDNTHHHHHHHNNNTSCHISPVDTTGPLLSASADGYFPLETPLLMSSRQASSAMPSYCFFGGDENRQTSNRDTLYPLYDDSGSTSPTDLTLAPSTGSALGALPCSHTSDNNSNNNNNNTAAAKLPLSPSSASSLNVLDTSTAGWAPVAGTAVVATADVDPSSSESSSSTCTPLWPPQFSRQSSLDELLSPTTPSSNYRVSISMMCHPGQLADVMSQMSSYGSGVTFNFAADE